MPSPTVRALGLLCLLMLSLAAASPGAGAEAAADTPRTIRVALDNVYAPYSFHSDAGRLQGILVDEWRAWEKKTGIKVELQALDWAEALRRTRAGEFDVIDSIVATDERRDYFDFTAPYDTIEVPIFFRRDISGVADIASLRGFPVGVKTGDQHVDKLREQGVTTLIPFESYDRIIEAARQHKINVFVADAPSALYLLNKTGIAGDFRSSAPIFRDELRRAVRKGDAFMLRTVSDGFAAIDTRDLARIREKWFGSAIGGYGQYASYAAYAAGVAILLIAGLAAWNRTLRKGILHRTAELQGLSRRLVELQESERRQLARELHDRVGQSLTALNINIAILRQGLSRADADITSRVDDSVALLKSTMEAIENVSSELRPPMLDDHGLRPALDWYAKQFSARTGIAASVRASVPDERMAGNVEIALFRIVQEALTNVAKHAQAGRVDIALECSGPDFVLSVIDDGVGLCVPEERAPAPRPGLGMVTMRERAQAVGGLCAVESDPAGSGTRLTVRIPG